MARKKDEKSAFTLPFMVRLFSKYVRKWSWIEGVIFVEPKSTILKVLIFRPAVVGLADTKWYITAVYEHLGEGSMNEEAKKLYRRLKGMECQLEVKGLLRKSVVFKPNRDLMILKHHIPALEVSDRLYRALNENDEVIRLVRVLKPSDMSISLYSEPSAQQPLGSASLQGSLTFFDNPLCIRWLITLDMIYTRGIGLKREADNVFKLFEEVCKVIMKEQKV